MEALVKKLTEAYGPSGYEDKVRELIIEEIKDYVDGFEVDTMGNLIAHKGNKNGFKVMVASHMDEIGVVISHIDKKGFLRFAPIGGVFPINILGQRVVFMNGVVGAIGEEKRETMKDELKIDKMYIDIGATSEEDAKRKVSVGDIGCFERNFVSAGKRFISKAFDDRIGCVVAIETIKNLKETPNNVYFVFTVQEEIGLKGAKTSSYKVTPDMAIVLDVTATGDTPEASTMAVELGKGPAIKVRDLGFIVNQKVKNLLVSIAQENSIPYQLEVLEKGTTDAMAIQLTKDGVPVGVISIPCRYVHTPSELVDKSDVENSIKLLTKVLQKDLCSK